MNDVKRIKPNVSNAKRLIREALRFFAGVLAGIGIFAATGYGFGHVVGFISRYVLKGIVSLNFQFASILGIALYLIVILFALRLAYYFANKIAGKSAAITTVVICILISIGYSLLVILFILFWIGFS